MCSSLQFAIVLAACNWTHVQISTVHLSLCIGGEEHGQWRQQSNVYGWTLLSLLSQNDFLNGNKGLEWMQRLAIVE